VRGFGEGEAGEEAEEADDEVNEVVVEVEAELDGAEVVQAEETGEGKERVDRPEEEAK